ncbi:hypothetical protein OHC33_001467 [Knufia fluminis]|uniref:Uncharacterized protein n=1 Tax=Knufia fluminis TaxID=191047 RepID=A0AAN8ERD3_9EURO|nr:hypothetical protein OHC33_001467 [Knufia fluminis]
MATWRDIPAEIKQMIFQLVCTSDSIVYRPKDRRLNRDERYDDDQHFYDVLLVSKTFITPTEFASAALLTAKLKLKSANELTRLCKEVSPAFKSCIRRINLQREVHHPSRSANRSLPRDSFESLSKIEKTLSVHLPNLRQIFITWPDYCANIGHHHPTVNRTPPSDTHHEDMLRYACVNAQESDSDQTELARPTDFTVGVPHQSHNNALPYVAASFLADRKTALKTYTWTRPIPALRRLILFAEKQDIEVILNITLCITNASPDHFYVYDRQGNKVDPDPCWSSRQHYVPRVSHRGAPPAPGGWHWLMHSPARMSTRDWMLRCTIGEDEYAFHQKLAYDMVHAPAGKAFVQCEEQMKVLRYNQDVKPYSSF